MLTLKSLNHVEFYCYWYNSNLSWFGLVDVGRMQTSIVKKTVKELRRIFINDKRETTAI